MYVLIAVFTLFYGDDMHGVQQVQMVSAHRSEYQCEVERREVEDSVRPFENADTVFDFYCVPFRRTSLR